jgi:hypothetical protein
MKHYLISDYDIERVNTALFELLINNDDLSTQGIKECLERLKGSPIKDEHVKEVEKVIDCVKIEVPSEEELERMEKESNPS